MRQRGLLVIRSVDQGDNVLEVLDTLAPQPPGYDFRRDWQYYSEARRKERQNVQGRR